MTKQLRAMIRGGLTLAMAIVMMVVAVPTTAGAEHANKRVQERSHRYTDEVGYRYADHERRRWKRGRYNRIPRYRVRHARHDRHDRHARHDRRAHGVAVQVHGSYCESSGHRGGHGVRHQEQSYTCKPCNHRFGSANQLRDHVHHHHRIPLLRLPFVLVESILGLVFYG